MPVARAQQAGAATAQQQKKYQDGEYDLYKVVVADLGGKDFAKTIRDLDAWTAKCPNSDYKNERLLYYVQTYSNLKDSAKVVDTGAQLLEKDLKATFADQGQVLTVYYLVCANVQGLASPTPEQLATGVKASKELLEFLQTYKPAGASDADWAKAKPEVENLAKNAQMFAAIKPGSDLAAKKDYPGAVAAFTTALKANPDSGQVAYELGRALISGYRTDAVKVSQALYYVARAVVADPAKGGISDATLRKQIEAYLDKTYTSYHGSDDGLAQLKQSASSSAFPADGFKIETASEIAARKEEEFKSKNPQLAQWLGIKGQLAANDGETYFANSLKDADLTSLGKNFKGQVLSGEPACKSKTLLVAIPEPDQQGTIRAEITLKLEKPLTGKAEAGEIEFMGVPTAFTKEPFMLTMDTENAKITGLKMSPCAAAPAVKKGAAKKGAAKK